MMRKKAEAGIGSLILFIAMIIVASITVTVFMQTAGSLQNKALTTASASQSMVSNRMNVAAITAIDGENSDIKQFRIRSSVVAGSDGIKLSTALLSMELSNGNIDLVYSNESCVNVSDSSGDGYFTDGVNSNGTFTVSYLTRGAAYAKGYLQRGDVINICFEGPRNISEDENLKITFAPAKSSQTITSVSVPDIITTTYVRLYP